MGVNMTKANQKNCEYYMDFNPGDIQFEIKGERSKVLSKGFREYSKRMLEKNNCLPKNITIAIRLIPKRKYSRIKLKYPNTFDVS